MENNTAILVFTRRTSEEAKCKQLTKNGSYSKNHRIFNTLIKQSIIVASQTSAEVFVINDKNQRGSTFGEKLANAFQDVYAKGFQKVIAIGNDCPELTADLLEKTIAELQKKDFVIGPSKDGGMYLIGMDKSSFHFQSFSNLDWQTQNTLVSFLSFARAKRKTIHLLRSLIDLDNFESLLNYIKSGSYAVFIQKVLDQILDNPTKLEVVHTIPFYSVPFYKIDLKRGPPALAA
ncbi:MAG: DUF2064 domain-containing protein [Bacteroidetes bacterium]|nr:DUF2064 domain-containing protein [Bacteroidota bacterium]